MKLFVFVYVTWPMHTFYGSVKPRWTILFVVVGACWFAVFFGHWIAGNLKKCGRVNDFFKHRTQFHAGRSSFGTVQVISAKKDSSISKLPQSSGELSKTCRKPICLDSFNAIGISQRQVGFGKGHKTFFRCIWCAGTKTMSGARYLKR